MSRAREMSAQQRYGEQSLLREKTKLQWDGTQYRGRIHVARVVRHQHVPAIRIELLNSGSPATYETHREQNARPPARHPMLRKPRPVPQRSDERNTAHENRGKHDSWRGE